MSAKRKRILFLTLRTFSLTGGIEKICRSISMALFKIEQEGHCYTKTYSIYDRNDELDIRYLPALHFEGFSGNRLIFILKALFYGVTCDKIILSHINLLPAAWIIKLIAPKARIILFAHGIEMWRPIQAWERRFLRNRCHQIWAVSNFTANEVARVHKIHPSMIKVINNCIDPFFEPPVTFAKPGYLVDRYDLNEGQPVLLTLTRLSSSEAYKGYNLVIECVPQLIKNYPGIKYLIAGKADDVERIRLEALIASKNLQNHVFLIGFIPENELSSIFLLSDIFIMPSKKEGFGIVFIEAAVCGCKIIAGNHDGSPDALLNGRLGTLLNPDNKNEMVESITEDLNVSRSEEYAHFIQSLCLSTFGFPNYIEKLKQLISCE